MDASLLLVFFVFSPLLPIPNAMGGVTVRAIIWANPGIEEHKQLQKESKIIS